MRRTRRFGAVLPVRSRAGLTVPFLHASEMLEGRDPKASPLSDFALEFERARGGLDDEGVFARMRHILEIVKDSSGVGHDWELLVDRVHQLIDASVLDMDLSMLRPSTVAMAALIVSAKTSDNGFFVRLFP